MTQPLHDGPLGRDEASPPGPAHPSPRVTAIHHRVFQRTLNLVEATVFLALAGTIFGFLGRFHFFPDLATHFRFQSTTGLLLGGGLLLLCRRRLLGWSGLLVGTVLLATFWPYVVPQTTRSASETYRFVVMNVLTSNSNRRGVTEYLKQLEPDFLLLMEVDDSWQKALHDALKDDLPHSFGRTRGDNFGIWFMSRHAWDEAHLAEFGHSDLPSVDVRLHLDRPLRVVGTHPLPPMSPAMWKSRNAQLAEVAASIGDDPLSSQTLLAGDFNSSPWSTFFRRLKTRSQLTDSAEGHGLPPTWYVLPTWLGGLPIDHVLVGAQMEVRDRSVGPDLGSDHRAVIVDFAWRAE